MQSAEKRLLLVGERITESAPRWPDERLPRHVPARHLLDAARELDSNGYFSLTGRIVVIGASHAGSADKWRTVVGYMPGMELVANTIRFAPIQLRNSSDGFMLRSALESIAAFILLALIGFFLRPFVAVIAATAVIVGLASFCASVLGWLEIFQSLEIALWCFVGFQVVINLHKFLNESRPYKSFRRLRSLLAPRIRKGDPECPSSE